MTTAEHTAAREMIPELLDRCRPDRYDPADKTWQSEVVDLVAAELDFVEARQIAASKLVAGAETAATRRTNNLLREIIKTGAWPLDWFDAMAWPLALDDNERVALRAAHPEDFASFANRERRAAAADFTARNSACEGALYVADYMESRGIEVASDINIEDAA